MARVGDTDRVSVSDHGSLPHLDHSVPMNCIHRDGVLCVVCGFDFVIGVL